MPFTALGKFNISIKNCFNTSIIESELLFICVCDIIASDAMSLGVLAECNCSTTLFI